MIYKLRGENLELKEKEREYSLLQSQLLDLEHRFKVLQEDKARMDMESYERQELQRRKNFNIEEELQRVNGSIIELEKQSGELLSNLNFHKTLVEEKAAEINRLKSDIAALEDENSRIAREKRDAEVDLSVVKKGHLEAKDETDQLLYENEKLKKDQDLAENRYREADLEAAKLSKRVEEAQLELDTVKNLCFQREKDLDAAREGKKFNQAEADTQLIKNNNLQKEKSDLLKTIDNLNLDIEIIRKKLNDTLTTIDAKDKDLKAVKMESMDIGVKEFRTREEVSRLQKDNETLGILLEKYKRDSETQKKFRDEESMRKYQLEEEKKKLSRDALLKDIEAQKAKRELEKVQESHDRLLDEREQMSQELSAVKEHTEVLQGQNYTVQFF